MDVIASRARAPKYVCIGLLVVALLLGATPSYAKKKASSRRYRLPVARKWAPDRKLNDRHHDYPAWDLAVPKRTAVRAVHAGRVRSVTRWGACGRGVIIRGADGYEYTYCHGAWVFAKKRRWVKTGQKIMLSGSTGHSTGPHLHLQIRGPRGQLLCPQPLLKKWARGKQASPRSTTARGCAYSPDRDSYRSHRRRGGSPRARRTADRRDRRSHKQRSSARGRDRDRSHKPRSSARGRDRDRSHKQRSSARKPANRRRKHGHGKRHRTRARYARLERKKQRRRAQRRRRWKARAELIRDETAARRARLALDHRVQPLI